jgi:hypothetical protein
MLRISCVSLLVQRRSGAEGDCPLSIHLELEGDWRRRMDSEKDDERKDVPVERLSAMSSLVG